MIFFTLKVAIHYYGRLAAKQGWRFDSTYDHKDENGDPNPFVFVLGAGKVSLNIIVVHLYGCAILFYSSSLQLINHITI